MTLPPSSALLRRGTRRLHVGSDRVWRLVQIDLGELLIVRQGDGREQLVHSSTGSALSGLHREVAWVRADDALR